MPSQELKHAIEDALTHAYMIMFGDMCVVMQVGKINSIAALHDAQSKQVLNPLKMRKAPQGDAANPVIRQRSVAQQAKHKQRFADTLRGDSDAEPATLANEQSMSLSAPQQQPEDQAEHIGAHYHAQLTPYGSALTSSKSEPHGQCLANECVLSCIFTADSA